MESVIFDVHTSISKFIHFNLAVCNSRGGGAPLQERSALYPPRLELQKVKLMNIKSAHSRAENAAALRGPLRDAL